MDGIYLLLGTNLGNKSANIFLAKEKIKQQGIIIIKESSVYETSPWGFNHPESFYNQVIFIQTSIGPDELMSLLLGIEKKMGRSRSSTSYEARIIDIDILYYNNDIIESEFVTIPHPKLHLRKFTLVPLCEIATEFKHPKFKKSTSVLLYECTDTGEVKLVK